jgi:microcystin-dependent protein
MVDCYLGEIRMFGGNYAPEGWALCDGRILPVSGNEALYSLIGNIYGGSAPANFALPDLRGRLPVHTGQGLNLTARALGQMSGAETVTLTTAQLPAHTHAFEASSSTASSALPRASMTYGTLAEGWLMYAPPGDVQQSPFLATEVQSAGASQPHSNVMPGLTISYIIALSGLYPSPT